MYLKRLLLVQMTTANKIFVKSIILNISNVFEL